MTNFLQLPPVIELAPNDLLLVERPFAYFFLELRFAGLLISQIPRVNFPFNVSRIL